MASACHRCGVEILPSFRFCAGCGRRLARLRGWRLTAVVTIAGAAVIVLGIWMIQPRLSAGPAAATQVSLTLAPGVKVEIVPTAPSLADASFDGFALSKDGVMVGTDGSRLVDLRSGTSLLPEGQGAGALAFVGDALAIGTPGAVGYYDDGHVESVVDAPFFPMGMASTGDGASLLLFRWAGTSNSAAPALAEIRQGQPLMVLERSREPITAAGGDARTIYFAKSGELYRRARGGTERMLALPTPETVILGIVVVGQDLYFSTGDAVYAVRDDLVVPIVLGAGGMLRAFQGDLFVLGERTHGRVYRVSFTAGASS